MVALLKGATTPVPPSCRTSSMRDLSALWLVTRRSIVRRPFLGWSCISDDSLKGRAGPRCPPHPRAFNQRKEATATAPAFLSLDGRLDVPPALVPTGDGLQKFTLQGSWSVNLFCGSTLMLLQHGGGVLTRATSLMVVDLPARTSRIYNH